MAQIVVIDRAAAATKTIIDSTVISVLIRAYQQSQSLHLVVAPSGEARRAVDLAGIDARLPV